MFLKHFHLSQVIVVAVIAFAFLKIYQHNLIIKLQYEKQRLEQKTTLLRKERNELLAVYAQLQNPEKVIGTARQEWQMKPLALHQVRYIPSHADVAFLRTTSTIDVLKKLCLYDLVSNHTGENHVSSRL